MSPLAIERFRLLHSAPLPPAQKGNIHVRASPNPVLRHRQLCRLLCFMSLRARFRRQLSRANVDRRRRAHEFERGHRRRPAAARHICHPAQHYGAPRLQAMVGQDPSGGLPALDLRAALQPDPPAAILAVAADPDTRLADRRNCGLVADRRLLARLVDRACLDLHDRSFRSVRPAPGFLRAARRRDACSIVQDAPALQNRAASAHAGLSARILGHACDDRRPFAVRDHDHSLHPGRAAVRGAGFDRSVRHHLPAVSPAGSHAAAAHFRSPPDRSITMRAVLCSAFTGPEDLCVGEIEEPKPASDEILIDVHAASVSFMDHLLVSGLYQMRPSTPFVPGTEAAGVVIAVGAKVTRFQPGDRVACGSWTGGYAERMIDKEWKSVRLPVGVTFETAATVWHNYGTAYYALVEGARAQHGETVFVTGAAGGVGLAAVDLARHLGLRVIAGVGSDDKAGLVRGYGACDVINYRG